MSGTFQLTIVNVDRHWFSGEVQSVVVPTTTGELGVLAGHTPFLAMLGTGKLRFTRADNQTEEAFFVSGGFVEIQGSQVVVLADELLNLSTGDAEIEVAMARIEARAERYKKILALSASEVQAQVSQESMDKARVMLEQSLAQMASLQRINKVKF